MTDNNTKVKKKKRGGLLGTILLVLIFVVGLGVMAYPLISQLYYYRLSTNVISTFEEGKREIEETEINERMQLAHAYNDSLVAATLEDPYSEEEKAAGRAEYARMLEVKEQIGHIKVPKLLLDAPVYAGTSEEILQKGIGHLEGSSLPVGGNSTHSVLTGHRGLPNARLFTDLDKLAVGDKFYYYNIGETIAYQIDQILIIEPHVFTDLLVVPGHDYMTLLTCTPYMVNSHRLLVRGHRIPYTEAIAEMEIRDNQTNQIYKLLFFVTLAVLLLVLLLTLVSFISRRRRAKKLAKKLESQKQNDET